MTEQGPETPDRDRLLDHDVDGIREYDNPLPRWWVNLFWATIAFAVLYFVNVIPGIGTGDGRIANYERDMAAAEAGRDAAASKAAPVSAADLLGLTQNATALAAGKARFTTTCAPCHRADGGGNIGPNLTDNYWIHGGAPTQILATVTNGVLEKGMPQWGPVLKPEELKDVVAYVLTLHGTNPANAKAPQGDPMAATADTTAAAPAAKRGLP
ncbi:MAG: cbb3-type cytochrome c oxidase N-terminal domain-containing protein [Hyphomicrobiales bacterium]